MSFYDTPIADLDAAIAADPGWSLPHTMKAGFLASLTEPALLSRCDGNQPLARGDESPAAKAPVPAATPGRLTVSAVGFPKLQTGGSLVELQVSVPADRVVMVTR